MIKYKSSLRQALNTRKQIGGKAHRLRVLGELGLPVPAWIVLSVGQVKTLVEQGKGISSVTLLAIERRMEEVFGSGYRDKYYAVRSSAPEEDGANRSFAGQFSSFLNVPFKEIARRIKEVYQSAEAAHVEAYRELRQSSNSSGMAIILQEMVYPEVSGVAFGCDPLTGDSGILLISAVYGLGEGLVSGHLDADRYTLRGAQIQSDIVEKRVQFQASGNGGIERVPVPKTRWRQAALNTRQCNKIASWLRLLRTHFKSPQDIEFAVEKGKLYLLQARDVTAIGLEKSGSYTVWDNSNIVESYPGVTTPLTFSFILKMYEQVYRQLGLLMGISPGRIEENKEIFEQTLGLVRGRVYYNLKHWYKMLSLVPGYSLNARFMEQMMGVKERFDLDESHKLNRGVAIFQTAKSIVKMIGLQWSLRRETASFMRFLEEVLTDYKKLPLERMEATRILEYYREFEHKVLLQWKAPLVNDFFTMIWFGLLEKQVRKHLPEKPYLHNALLCGSRDIVSTEPVHRMLEMVEYIRSNEALCQYFKRHSATEIYTVLQRKSFAGISEMFFEYIEQFGDRCLGELKLESISYRISPPLLIEHIRSYLNKEATIWTLDDSIDRNLRAEAEDEIDQALRGKPLQRKTFQFVLKQARTLVSNRENLRFERTKAFGMVRRMFRALGRRWYEAGILDSIEDVFYLKREEILAAVDGVPHIEAVSNIVKRKKLFLEYADTLAPVERFYTYGEDFSDAYIYASHKLPKARKKLQGTACCPGKVKAKVRVVHRPDEIEALDGEILVTTSTDPGWVILFPSAAGILVARGSLLSHAAIVSREMGVPCIVGIEGLMSSLHTGDEVLMDGRTGEISVLEVAR